MKYSEFPTYFAVFTSYTGVMTNVFLIAYISPTQKQLIEENILNYKTLPIFASICLLTSILGIILASILIQTGSNLNVLKPLNYLIGGIGYVLIITATSGEQLILGVAVAGFSIGISIIFISTYIAGITLDTQRRVSFAGYGLCMRIGIFYVYLLGIWLPFRWLAGVGLVQILVCLILQQLNPPSPVWYVRQGLDEKAKTTLQYLHGRDFDTDTEIQKIKSETLSSNISWSDSVKALKEWKVLKPILLMCAIASLKELGGHEAIMAFSSHILESQQAMDPRVASLFYPIFLIAGAIVSISIIKYCKLKWLLIIASVFQAISHISMAIYFLISDNHLHCMTLQSHVCRVISFWPIFNIALFAFSFAFGWGLVFFTLIGVIFAVHREFSTEIVAATDNASSYLVVMAFFYLLHNIGGFVTFLIFSANYFIAICFVYFCVTI